MRPNSSSATDLIAARKQRFLAVDSATFHGACEALSTLDVRDKLAGVKMPVLVLVGEQDDATPPPKSQELAAPADAQFETLAGCAHVPQLQAPEQFLQAIRPSSGTEPRLRPAVAPGIRVHSP